MGDLRVAVVEGPGAGREVRVIGPTDIGREAGAQLVLDDPLVSRRHARLTPQAHAVTVEDLGSTNGTFVDDVQIHASTWLFPGHRMQVGTSVLVLSSDGPPPAVTPVPQALARPAATPDFVPKEIAGDLAVPELQSLFDKRIKRRAQLAPVAIFVLVAFAVLLYLALSRG